MQDEAKFPQLVLLHARIFAWPPAGCVCSRRASYVNVPLRLGCPFNIGLTESALVLPTVRSVRCYAKRPAREGGGGDDDDDGV